MNADCKSTSLRFLVLFLVSGMAASMVTAQVVEQEIPAGQRSIQFSEADEHGRYVHLVRFAEPGMLHRQTRVSGARFDPNTPAMQAARADIQSEQQAHIQSMADAIGRSLDVTHYYLATHSGLATRLTPTEAATVSRLAGIVAVERERVYQPDTYRGPEFMGAGAMWDGSGVPDGTPLVGGGMVAGVLDTGIDADHPSFANDAACGHGDSLPDKLLSALDCSSTDVSGLCNGPGPQDTNRHGTHVSGTVAGNVLDETADPAPNLPGPFTEMSGVAPCAHVRSYRVCPDSCPAAQIQAGMDSILLHGDVDVMNFSISGGQNPWVDNDRRKLDLVDAGVFVAASAGNTSATVPDPVGNVGHRGPWVMAVAASTRDTDASGGVAQGDVLAGFSLRGPTPPPLQDLQKPDITAPGVGIFAATVGFEMSVTGPGVPPDELVGIGMNLGSDSPLGSPLIDHPIAFDPTQPPGEDGCDPGFAPSFFDGQVALIERGGCPFTEKINNAFDAGADMVVIRNNQPGGLSMSTPGQANIPAFSISQDDGQALIDFIVVNPSATIEYLAQLVSQYNFLSGTSMSSPHLAGGALLVRQANPDWTPAEAKSALRMTAHIDGTKEDQTTPWDWDDVGSGRADLNVAALAGMVMNETFQNFLDANPGTGGDVKTLNLPALRNLDCTPNCVWTRTVRNTLDEPTSWNFDSDFFSGDFDVDVDPPSFDFTGGLGETQTITVTVTPIGDQTSAIHFGEVVFSETGANSPDLRWTLAASGAEGAPPEAQISPDSFDFLLAEDGSGSATLNIANLGDVALVYSIDQAEPASIVLEATPDAGRDGQIEPIELIVDGGFPPAGLVGVGAQEFLWFNQFTPGALDVPFTLEEVEVAFVTASTPGQGAQVGDLFDVHIWSAPDGDPTGNVTLLASATGQIITAMDAFNSVLLPGGVDIDASTGDVLIGVVNRSTRDPHFPAASDSGVASQQRSWIAFNFPGGVAGDPPDFSEAGTFGLIDDFLAGRNWLVRGFGTGGSACLNPSDVPWLTVTPDAGTVAGGNNEDILVEVDMTGQGLGEFEARLCIETNDPQLPKKVVPVTVEVVDAGDLPVIDVSPESMTFETEPENPSDTQVLDISNQGTGVDLEWFIEQAEAMGAGREFEGDFDIGNWELVNTPAGVNGSFHTEDGPPIELYVVGGDDGVGGDTDFQIEIPADGVINFDWGYQSDDIGDWDSGGYAVNGDYTELADNASQVPYFNESASVEVSAGDIFAFRAHTVDGTFGAGTFGVTNFNFEPDDESACDMPSDVSWLSVDPASGSTAAGMSAPVDVIVDGTGLTAGIYQAVLCVHSNDPETPLVEVPVDMTVTEDITPIADISPGSFEFTAPEGGTDQDTLFIGNLGSAALTWQIDTTETGGRSGVSYRSSRAVDIGHAEVDTTETVPLDLPVGYDRAAGIEPSGQASARIAPAPRGGPVVGDWSEGFNDIDSLPAAGWAMQNNSDPVGASGWFQGNPTVFESHQGASDAYIGANFNNTTGANTISNWLMTPEIALHNGTELRFWTRTSEGSNFPDRLEVRLSTSGDSIDVGTGPNDVGDFDQLLLSINENLDVGGYPEGWTEYLIEIEGLPESTTGRFALRYHVTDGGPSGSNSNYIGIDTLSVTQPPSACEDPVSVTWLSVDPSSGTTGAGDPPGEVSVQVDASGLADGEYGALLCVVTNDPNAELVEIPVSLTIETPIADISPASFSFELAAGDSDADDLIIGNIGDADLNWNLLDPASMLLYDSGPLISNPGEGPGGTDISLLQNSSLGMTTLGVGVNPPNLRAADDFEVTEPWGVTSMTFYAYQTGSPTSSTITHINLRIWDGPPDDGGSVIFGDDSTNVLQSTQWINAYRVSETGTPEDRPIMEVVADTSGLFLEPGTYWVDVQIDGSLASGPWMPPITIPDETTTGNALRETAEGWEDWIDNGTGTQQGMVFLIHGIAECFDPSEVDWLDVNPTAGTVAPNDSQTAVVTADASGLTVGTYETRLCVTTNDPNALQVNVPVTLNVTESMATVEGFVMSLGYCSDNPSPANGANILIHGQLDNYAGAADSDGFYQITVPADESPVDVEVSFPDHNSVTVTDIDLTAGETSVVDVDLVLNAPCATVTPASLGFVLSGGEATEVLTIGNSDGAAALSWSLASGGSCFEAGAVGWLTVSSEEDTVAAGTSQAVDVTADSAGLEPGVYETDLCIDTDDAEQDQFVVPVTLEVQGDAIFHDRFEADGS